MADNPGDVKPCVGPGCPTDTGPGGGIDKPVVTAPCPQVPIPDPATWQNCFQYTSNVVNNFYDSTVTTIEGDLTINNTDIAETFNFIAEYITNLVNQTVNILNEVNNYYLTEINNIISYYQEFIDTLINNMNTTNNTNISVTATAVTFNPVTTNVTDYISDTYNYYGTSPYVPPPPPPPGVPPPPTPPPPSATCPEIKLKCETDYQYYLHQETDDQLSQFLGDISQLVTADTTMSVLVASLDGYLPTLSEINGKFGGFGAK